jgi:hypothetical protein
MKDRVLVVRTLQVVVGDASTQMVHLVQADAAREELQDLGQPRLTA